MFTFLRRRFQVHLQAALLVAMLAGIVAPLAQALAASPAQAAGTPTLTTDQTDYAPEQTVHVSGTGFDPSADYAIPVMRPGW